MNEFFAPSHSIGPSVRLCGYLRRDGIFSIEPQFLEACSFIEDVAIVLGELERGTTAFGIDREGAKLFSVPKIRWIRNGDSIPKTSCPKYPVCTLYNLSYNDGTSTLHEVVDCHGVLHWPYFSDVDCEKRLERWKTRSYPYVPKPDNRALQSFFEKIETYGLRDGRFKIPIVGGSHHVRLIAPTPFHNGRSHVSAFTPEGELQIVLIDESGNLVSHLPINCMQVGQFSEGLAAVIMGKAVTDTVNGELQTTTLDYFDVNGAVVLSTDFQSPYIFSDCQFHEGLAIVRSGGYFGAIDKNGALQIPAKFERLTPISADLMIAGVSVDSDTGELSPLHSLKPVIHDCRHFLRIVCDLLNQNLDGVSKDLLIRFSGTFEYKRVGGLRLNLTPNINTNECSIFRRLQKICENLELPAIGPSTLPTEVKFVLSRGKLHLALTREDPQIEQIIRLIELNYLRHHFIYDKLKLEKILSELANLNVELNDPDLELNSQFLNSRLKVVEVHGNTIRPRPSV